MTNRGGAVWATVGPGFAQRAAGPARCDVYVALRSCRHDAIASCHDRR